jgi:hypothetical protein
MAEWYDTKNGLEIAVKNGIPGLTELAKERHKAGYERKERLDQWCLLGLYMLDSCGNFSKMIEGAPHSRRREVEIPKVMTYEEVNKYTDRWSAAMERCLPPVVEKCDRCLHGWDMHNIHDYYPPHREKDSHRHYTCQCLFVIQDETEYLVDIIKASEMPYDSVRAIPNEYYSSDPAWFGPWLIVETKWGALRIGPRKRVINIDWSGTQINHNGEVTFKDEEVTKGRTMIHAWGKDKAVEYLRTLSKGNFAASD